ncbi:hypothetical protein ANABIO32_28490 [Rossellomorea marisflavi]|nr:hypothetical protein ANABIO32_28490 [Rossellomorea marisflavi]
MSGIKGASFSFVPSPFYYGSLNAAYNSKARNPVWLQDSGLYFRLNEETDKEHYTESYKSDDRLHDGPCL